MHLVLITIGRGHNWKFLANETSRKSNYDIMNEILDEFLHESRGIAGRAAFDE